MYLTNSTCVFYSVSSGHSYRYVGKERLGDLKSRRKKRTDEKVRQHLGTWWGREGEEVTVVGDD